MWTQALLSPKIAKSHYCFECPRLKGTSTQQEAGTPPRQISHMEWFRGVWFTAQPPGSTSPFPSPHIWRGGISFGFPHCLLCYDPAYLHFYCSAFSCPVFLLPLLAWRFIGCSNFNLPTPPRPVFIVNNENEWMMIERFCAEKLEHMEQQWGTSISCWNKWSSVYILRISGYKIQVCKCPVCYRLDAVLKAFMICGSMLGMVWGSSLLCRCRIPVSCKLSDPLKVIPDGL